MGPHACWVSTEPQSPTRHWCVSGHVQMSWGQNAKEAKGPERVRNGSGLIPSYPVTMPTWEVTGLRTATGLAESQ